MSIWYIPTAVVKTDNKYLWRWAREIESRQIPEWWSTTTVWVWLAAQKVAGPLSGEGKQMWRLKLYRIHMDLILFIFLLLVIATSRKGNKMLFSLILCDSFLAPVIGSIFSQHLICPWSLHWQKHRGKGISEREVDLFSVLRCSHYTLAIQGLLSLCLCVYMHFCSFVLHFTGISRLTSVQKQPR